MFAVFVEIIRIQSLSDSFENNVAKNVLILNQFGINLRKNRASIFVLIPDDRKEGGETHSSYNFHI